MAYQRSLHELDLLTQFIDLAKKLLHIIGGAELVTPGIHYAITLVTDLLCQAIDLILELEDGGSSRVHLDEATLRC